MSCTAKPKHTADPSARTLVLLEIFILKKEKQKRTKNETTLSDYILAAELPVKLPAHDHVFLFISEFTVKRRHNLSECG